MTKLQKLRKNYDLAINNYLAYFTNKQGLYYEFHDEGFAMISDMFISINDIIYDVDNEVPAGKIIEYYDYSYERYINNQNPDNEKLTIVNYASFHKGMR